MIDILPLTRETLDGAMAVLDAQFGPNSPDPVDPDEFDSYRTWLPVSLSDRPDGKKVGEKGPKEEHDIDYLKYWVAFDPEQRKVVGVTGVFTKGKEPDRAYLGWMGVQVDYQGSHSRDIENSLMTFTMAVARSLGKRYLFSYFSDAPEDDGVRRFQFAHGFRYFDQEQRGESGEKVLFYRYDLRLEVD